MSMEIWKSIIGYEGLYEVSNYGKVKSLDRIESIVDKRGRLFNRTRYGSYLKPYNDKGYYKVQLSKNGFVKKHFIHRLVAEAYIENNLNKEQVNHKDLNGLNNNVSNLEWVTPSENVIHGHYTKKYQVKSLSLKKNGVVYHFKSQNEARRCGASALNRLLKGLQKETNGWSLV
jgi:hypothetical protein